MKRRQLLMLASGLILARTSAWAVSQADGPSGHKVSKAQLQRAVAERFPLRYPVGGLLAIDLEAPRLRLLPALNRLRTALVVQASGPALGRRYTGAFDLDFGLRYMAHDQTIRAYQLRVNALRFADLPPGPAALLARYGPTLAEQSLQDVVLHQLRPEELALPDGLGLQPDSLTVTVDGLMIGFVAKPLR
jgi:hypothetical protein